MGLFSRLGLPGPFPRQFSDEGLPLRARERACKVLAVGEVADEVRAALQRAGCVVGLVPGAGGAVVALKNATFEAVLVSPESDRGLGLKLIAALKAGQPFPGLRPEFLQPLVERTAALPFFVLPLAGEEEWALVFSEARSWVQPGGSAALVRALLHADFESLKARPLDA